MSIRHVDMGCSTQMAVDQIGRYALTEFGCRVVVVHYQDVDGAHRIASYREAHRHVLVPASPARKVNP